MGRLVEARKRARQARAGVKPGSSASPGVPGAAGAGPAPPGRSPEEPTASPRRIVLPPSGLAEEILAGLAAQEAQGSAPQAAAAASEAPPVDRIGFFALPAADEQSAPPQPSEHLATFLLDREEYGVDVRSVQEIIRVPAITPVPRAPERVRGVVNLRGRVIPVFDLKRALGVGEVQLARASRIVVVRLRDRLLGLLVDGAAQVLRVPVSSIVQPPEEAGPPEVAGVRGMARLPSRLIILLDLERVFEAELARETRPRDGRRA